MSALAGLRVLVIGGTGGIGLATARAMLEAGADAVTVAGRDAARGEQAARELGVRAHAVSGDAGVAADAERMVAEATEAMGGVDVLLACGGGDPMPRLLKDIPTDALTPAIANALAPIVTPARAVYSVMAGQGGGAILLMASDAGKIPTPGESAIGAAMAGIAMFGRAMAIEAKRDGIRVNCLTPSVVRGTRLYDRLMDDPFANRLFGKAEAMAHLGVVEPQDLAALAVFLASPAAAKITGQTVSVTGGISAL